MLPIQHSKQISLTLKNSKENRDGFPVWAKYGSKLSLNNK
jgi:hypothetical protein